MTIGVNGYEAVAPRFGYDHKTGLPNRVGSSEYCFHILTWLHRIDKKNEYCIYLPQHPPEDFPAESSHWAYKIISPKKLWTILGLSRSLLTTKQNLNVFFNPTHYLPFLVPYPTVITIFDLSYLFFPELFKKKDLIKLRYWTAYSLKCSQRVITISKSSKNDIIKYYRVPKDKVTVVYPGIKLKSQSAKLKSNVHNMKLLKEKYDVDGPYILFVGTLQPRKNIVRLIEAFARLKRITDLQLIIIGKRGWLYEDILTAPEKFGIEGKVKFLDFVPDEDLPAFYKNAFCFVLPSLYEGFGLPVLEAMKYGCPVLTSNVSSLPEAGGDAALYFDPLNTDDIAKNLELIIGASLKGGQNSELRRNMIEKGYQHVKKFSWEKAARETLEVLEEVARK